MMGLSLPHLLIVALVVLVLFGRGRISEMMGDFGKGIKSFKEGMHEETQAPAPPPAQISQIAPAPPVTAAPVVAAPVATSPVTTTAEPVADPKLGPN